MKKRFILIFTIIVVLLTVSVSFNIVQAVTGGSPAPGSDQDPLVSKSYVDSSISQAAASIQQANDTIQQLNTALGQANDALQKLQTQYDALQKSFDDLNTKVTTQDQTIKALQDAVKSVKTTPPSNSGGTSSQPTGSGGTTTQGSGAGKAVVNVASLNIRSQANTTSNVLAKALKGETVTIVSKNGEWYKIKNSKGVTGFILGKYVTVSK